MKKYCLITYSGRRYNITESQHKQMWEVVTKTEQKFLALPGMSLIAIADVKFLGEREKAPRTPDSGIPAEQEAKFLPPPDLGTLLLTGNCPDESPRSFRLMAKRTWFEHVKRRPAINKKLGRVMRYSQEEERIIRTPIDVLLADYAKELQAGKPWKRLGIDTRKPIK